MTANDDIVMIFHLKKEAIEIAIKKLILENNVSELSSHCVYAERRFDLGVFPEIREDETAV
jgi:hypothetical protein